MCGFETWHMEHDPVDKLVIFEPVQMKQHIIWQIKFTKFHLEAHYILESYHAGRQSGQSVSAASLKGFFN